MADLKKGDVVRLKSGGPDMTIEILAIILFRLDLKMAFVAYGLMGKKHVKKSLIHLSWS